MYLAPFSARSTAQSWFFTVIIGEIDRILIFQEKTCILFNFQINVQNISENLKISLKISKYLSISRNISQNLKISLNISIYLSISRNSSQNLEISLYTRITLLATGPLPVYGPDRANPSPHRLRHPCRVRFFTVIISEVDRFLNFFSRKHVSFT